MNNRRKAYTEVYTILQDLNEEEYNKIPPKVIETLKLNRDTEYKYEIEPDIKLKEQQMLPETKAILFNIFRDYLSTQEQKQKIIKMQLEEQAKIEIKKQEKYNNNIFKENERKTIKIEQTALDTYSKKKWYRKVFEFIRSVLKIHK